MSAEDEKSRSSWRKEKQRCQQPTRRRVVGVVAANELHPPERQLAVPPPIQQEVRGDFDGDFDLLVWVMKLLHQYLGECREQRRQEAGASLKLQKSHTEAVDDDGRYRHGRARQIVAAKLPVLADYTVMLRRFLAHPCRDELGEALLWPLCEGLEPGLADRMFGLLAPEQGTDDGDKRAAAAQERIERVRGELARGRDQASAGQARRMYEVLHALWAEVFPPKGERPDSPAPAVEPVAEERLREVLPPERRDKNIPLEARERLKLALAWMPSKAAAEDLPQGFQSAYEQGRFPPGRLAELLLGMGIKAGEDAAKSDTGVRHFHRLTPELREGMRREGVGGVPYGKGIARKVAAGELNTATAGELLRQLEHNPTFAAAVMERGLRERLAAGWIPEAPPPEPAEPAAVGFASQWRSALELWDRLMPWWLTQEEIDSLDHPGLMQALVDHAGDLIPVRHGSHVEFDTRCHRVAPAALRVIAEALHEVSPEYSAALADAAVRGDRRAGRSFSGAAGPHGQAQWVALG